MAQGCSMSGVSESAGEAAQLGNIMNRRLEQSMLFAVLLGSTTLFCACQKMEQPAAGHTYSTTIAVKLADWKPGTNTAGQHGFVVDLPLPQLDEKVVESGGVAVYYMFEGSNRYEPLPLVFNSVIYHAYHSKGQLSLRMFSANGQNLGPQPPPEVTDLKAKIVIF